MRWAGVWTAAVQSVCAASSSAVSAALCAEFKVQVASIGRVPSDKAGLSIETLRIVRHWLAPSWVAAGVSGSRPKQQPQHRPHPGPYSTNQSPPVGSSGSTKTRSWRPHGETGPVVTAARLPPKTQRFAASTTDARRTKNMKHDRAYASRKWRHYPPSVPCLAGRSV